MMIKKEEHLNICLNLGVLLSSYGTDLIRIYVRYVYLGIYFNL